MFLKRLKDIREDNDLLQKQVALALGITRQQYGLYEKGRVYISTENLYKFAKEFKISINELCGKTKK